MNNLDDAQLRTFNEFWNDRTSYILNSYDLTHTDISGNVTVILATIAAAIVCCYSLLVYKLKR